MTVPIEKVKKNSAGLPHPKISEKGGKRGCPFGVCAVRQKNMVLSVPGAIPFNFFI